MSSYNDLLNNVNSANESIKSDSPIDVSNYFLSDKEVVRNIIRYDNPSMSDDDINLMVDGFSTNGEFSKSESDINNLYQSGDTNFKQQQIKKSVEDSKTNQSSIPLPENSSYYEKAKALKKSIAKHISEFLRKVSELLKDITFASISLSQSIPGGIAMLAPFAFNVPGMITLIMNVILTLSQIRSKSVDVKGIFTNFDKIFLVFSPSSLNIVASILNTSFKLLDGKILGFVSKINDFINSALDAIKSIMSPDSEGRRARSITKKLRKLDYLPNNNYSKVDEDDQDEVSNILNEWEVYNKDSRNNAVRRKQTSKDSLDLALSEIEKLNTLNNELSKLVNIDINQDSESVVYDVELPNGEKLLGISKDAVDGLKSTYNVIYSANVKYNKIS